MARSFTPRDIHALMNQLVQEATGEASISVVDSSTFVSAGETVLATGTENVLNALSVVIGRTLVAVRPYEAKLLIINALNSEMYSNRMRKISFYARPAQASGDFNTQLYTNLEGGFDNGSNPDANDVPQSTASMWEQNKPEVLEMNFAGQSVWEESTTVYENQLKIAFTDEESFGRFVAGIMTEKANDIESQKEAFNRLTLLNYMAGLYDVDAAIGGNLMAINLTSEFNAKMGTSYTTAVLIQQHLKEFLEFFVAYFKVTSDYMTNRSVRHHWAPTKTDAHGNTLSILRHTPKSKQKFIYYSPFFTDAEAMVMPEIFNDKYLPLPNGEGVTYWQSIETPSEINVTPAIPDTTNVNGTQVAGSNVNLKLVLGVLFDEDALMVDYQLDRANSTPLEARKNYRNLWWSFSRNAINDFTEQGILFYLAD